MSILTPYIALAIFPLIATQFPNPVALYWVATKGSAPMPPDVADKVQRVAPYTLIPIHGLVATLVLVMMWGHSVPFTRVGLRVEHLPIHLGVGCALGLAWVGLQGIYWHLVPAFRASLATHCSQKGSALFWVLVYIVGAFSEEFWRAFCLVTLTSTGHSVSWSVILTAIAFGVGHIRLRLGALSTAILGVCLALLFVWLGCLVPTYSAHLIANVGGLFWVRRAGRDGRL